jgi:hypothetical protein
MPSKTAETSCMINADNSRNYNATNTSTRQSLVTTFARNSKENSFIKLDKEANNSSNGETYL